MRNEKPLPVSKSSSSEFDYLDLQAYMGTTKHMGGLEATKELIELCHIDEGAYILDVGCGVGATACYLARHHGCQVVGVDIREAMVARARDRAGREGLEERVEFRVADARDLPFEDAHFDAVVCESVVTFVEDKQRVVSECARVVSPGGYVGFNEEIWLQTPSPELIERARQIWDVDRDIPTSDGWMRLLEDAGLKDIVVTAREFDPRREASQVRRYGCRDFLRMSYKVLSLYITSPAFRKYTRGRLHLPQDLFAYLGYALFAGRK